MTEIGLRSPWRRGRYAAPASVLAQPGDAAVFNDGEIEELPEPVRRYFASAVADRVPLATSATLRMRGAIKLNRWLPFRAHQILNPHAGYVWAARVAWLISGADYYTNGQGGMDWKLAGLKQLVHAEGSDVSRAAAARGAAEAMWIPTAMLPRYGVEWAANDNHHIEASWRIDGRPFTSRLQVGDDGMVQTVVFDRWGDPDETGTWGMHPFGCEVTGYDTFHGLTIPTSGSVGWFYGTDRWDEGEFFRFQLTDLEPIATVPT